MGVGGVASARGGIVQRSDGPGGHDHAKHEGAKAPKGQAGAGVAALGGGGSIASALAQLTSAVAALTSALGVAGGGPTQVAGANGGPAGAPPVPPGGGDGAAAGCTCSSSGSGAEGASGAKGAKGAPEAKPAKDDKPRGTPKAQEQAGGGQDASKYASPKSASGSPQKLAGETSHANLQPKALQVLSAAHAAGLKLISGHRPGDDGGHGNGTAVDVANVPGGSKQGSPEMQQFAEAMRAAGKAGDPTVGYVIYQQKIASARDNWEWRPMEDRGSNTANHFDHVHVSTDPGR